MLMWTHVDRGRGSKSDFLDVIRGVNLYITLGGQIFRKLGKVQVPKARSCDC